jgi:DNA-directed RNA polymerase subunit RPC12/RpoP/transcription elongation factor Elf1
MLNFRFNHVIIKANTFQLRIYRGVIMVKLIKGQNDLLSQYPDCINEWDFKKNHPLSPDTITAGSSKKVWWICSKGHSYEQSINLHIIRGYSCPYCSHQKVFAGYNDLETLFPDIAKEWHPSKNAELTPSNVTAYSQKKVWWLCPMGHSYEQTVERRVRRGSACYYCSGHKVLKGFNDLASVNPSLAVEWHPSKNAPLTPYEVTAGSGKRVWWLCPIGHEYQATIHDRNTDNTQCPICNLRVQTSFPEQATFFYVHKLYSDAINKYKPAFLGSMELDIYIPSIHTGIEFDGANWHQSDEQYERDIRKYKLCQENHVKLIRIKEKNTRNWVDNAQTADVVYTISKVKKTGELETVLKVILDSIDASSNMWTRTDPRHIHSQIDVNIERDRPQILGYLTSIDNSLAILRPDVASKWDYVKNQDLTPDMFTVSSNEIIWWKCPDCGHEWKCSINSMTRKGRFGCAECSKKHRGRSFTQGVVKKVGSLAETMPELAKEWHPIKNGDLTPNDITAGKFKPVWWLCPKCGYEWQASPNNRKRGIGCPCCSGRVPKTGVNDLETLYPELLKEWNYERNSSNNLFPSQLLPKSGKKAWWKCSSCGHEWYAVIASRVKGHGCPHCSKRRKK